jgi:hypothetical protein
MSETITTQNGGKSSIIGITQKFGIISFIESNRPQDITRVFAHGALKAIVEVNHAERVSAAWAMP